AAEVLSLCSLPEIPEEWYIPSGGQIDDRLPIGLANYSYLLARPLILWRKSLHSYSWISFPFHQCQFVNECHPFAEPSMWVVDNRFDGDLTILFTYWHVLLTIFEYPVLRCVVHRKQKVANCSKQQLTTQETQ